MGLLELDGASAGLLHGLGIALVAARVMHPFGMRADRGPNVPRIAGTVITWVVLLIAAVTAIARFLAGSAPAA